MVKRMKKRKLSKHNKRKNITTSLITTIIIAIYFITIGYSSHSANAKIEDLMASVRPQAYVRITNVELSNTSNDGLSNAEDYNLSSIYGTVELPNQNSTVTYKVDVTVFLSSEMMIKSITGLSDNLEYELTDYTIGDILCDSNNQCNFGATKEFYITIKYKENGFDSSKTTYPYKLDFLFDSNNKIAKIGNRYFDTLQDAINTITTDNTETYVYLLNDTVENITTKEKQNIVLNLQGNTITNKANAAVIANYATLKILSGNIYTDAATNGAINNEVKNNNKGDITLDSVRVIVTGGRQALYNNKGIATIKGNSYLESASTQRAAVQNVSGGTMSIESGEIVSTGFHGVLNAGSLTIGINDGNVDVESPSIRGIKDGVNASSLFSYYDGVIKGKDNGISDETKIKNFETGYGLKRTTETISSVNYKVLTLAEAGKITFNPNGGIVSPTSKLIIKGEELGPLPTPTRSGYLFLGWFTDNGEQVNSNRIVDGDLTLIAHWEKNRDVARMNGTIYDTLQEAINATPNNTQTTIELLDNSSEKIIVNANKNIVLDLGTSVLSNSGDSRVIDNDGTLRIVNGTITSNSNQGAINNNQGFLSVGNTQIIATGSRQAIYIYDGTVEITSGAYLTSKTNGVPTGGTMERGTVQCLADGELIITGGTIVGERQQAVSNEGTLTIGSKDGNPTTEQPVLIGAVYGIKSSTAFNFYNGIIKGQTDAYYGTIGDKEIGTRIATGTETIDSKIYKTAYLEFE